MLALSAIVVIHTDIHFPTHTETHSFVCIFARAYHFGSLPPAQIGDTALLSAAPNGRTECIRVLLEAGADANVSETFVRLVFVRVLDLSYCCLVLVSFLLFASDFDI